MGAIFIFINTMTTRDIMAVIKLGSGRRDMPSKIVWLKHVAFISILIVVSWLWISLFSVSGRVYVLSVIVIVALYCVNAYLSSKLSYVWRLACFTVFSAIFLFVVFWPFEKFLVIFVLDAIGLTKSYLANPAPFTKNDLGSMAVPAEFPNPRRRSS